MGHHLLSPSPCGYPRRRTKFKLATRRRNFWGRSSIIVKRESHRRSHHRRHFQSNWSNICCETLEKVQRKLPFLDSLQCRAVCTRWRTVTQSCSSSSLNSPPPAQLPPLIIWHRSCWYDPHQFFDPARPGKYLFQLNRESNDFLLRRDLDSCVGFSHGWFLFVDKRKENILYLFRPLSSSVATALLPPIVAPEGYHRILGPTSGLQNFIKVVFWADPILSNGNYGIVVIHPLYKNLIFAKSGATQFTDLAAIDTNWYGKWRDIICFQNRIYGVGLSHPDGQHYMEAWDCTGVEASPMKVLDFQPKFRSGIEPSRKSTLNLVESQGELLLVSIQTPNSQNLCTRKVESSISIPELFVLARCPDLVRVYKMDFKEREWVQIHSLGDHVLFIMGHRNISVSIHQFPQYKRSTVYFKHLIWGRFLNRLCVGVFNLEDGSLTEIFPERQ